MQIKDKVSIGLLMPGSVNTSFQNKKGKEERKATAFPTLEPDRVVKAIKKMIIRNQKNGKCCFAKIDTTVSNN